MECRFCGGKVVRRKAMVHRTKKYHEGTKPAVERFEVPWRRYFCTQCKRVMREVA